MKDYVPQARSGANTAHVDVEFCPQWPHFGNSSVVCGLLQYKASTYCMARNIGREFNLADWRLYERTAK